MTPPAIVQFHVSNVSVAQLTLSSKFLSEAKIYDYGLNLSALQQTSTADRGLIAARQAYNTVLGKYFVERTSFVDISNAQADLL